MSRTYNDLKTSMKSIKAEMDVVCPRCGRQKSSVRIKRGLIARTFLSWLLHKKYHCQNCFKNFYKI